MVVAVDHDPGILGTFDGRFGTARALADQALDMGMRGGHDGAAFLHLVFRAHVGRLDRVGLDEAEAEVRYFLAAGRFLANTWLATLLIGMGRLDDASEVWCTGRSPRGLVPSPGAGVDRRDGGNRCRCACPSAPRRPTSPIPAPSSVRLTRPDRRLVHRAPSGVSTTLSGSPDGGASATS